MAKGRIDRVGAELSLSVTATNTSVIDISVVVTNEDSGKAWPITPTPLMIDFVAIGSEGNRVSGSEELGENGRADVRFLDVTPGTYSVQASVSGYSLQETKTVEVTDPKATKISEPRPAVSSFTAHKAGVDGSPIIVGTITPARGGILVEVYNETIDNRWTTRTDADGTYQYPPKGTTPNPLAHKDFCSFRVDIGGNSKWIESWPVRPKQSWVGNIVAVLCTIALGFCVVWWLSSLVSTPILSYNDAYEKYHNATPLGKEKILLERQMTKINPVVPEKDLSRERHRFWLLFWFIALLLAIFIVLPLIWIWAWLDDIRWAYYKARITVSTLAGGRGGRTAIDTGAIPVTDATKARVGPSGESEWQKIARIMATDLGMEFVLKKFSKKA